MLRDIPVCGGEEVMANKSWIEKLKDAVATLTTNLATHHTALGTHDTALGTHDTDIKNAVSDVDGDLVTHATALGTHDTDIKNLLATIAAYIDAEVAATLLLVSILDLTVFDQEAVGATDVNGVTWKDLLDKSTITKPTKICGFKVTVAGTWAGKAQVRITDGSANKIFPFQAQYEQDAVGEFESGVAVAFLTPVVVPIADGYKFQFRSTNAGDGAGETLELNNLDIIEVG